MDAAIQNMERFQKAVQVVEYHEGIMSHDKYDPGGITRFGISLRFLKAAGIDIDMDGDIDADDIRAIDRTKERDIFYKKFWKPYRFNEIKSESIAIKLFDLSINMGTRQAIRLLQESINNINENNMSVIVDGKLGNKTLHAINNSDQMMLLIEFKMIAVKFYRSLVEKNPVLEKFIEGWERRAMS